MDMHFAADQIADQAKRFAAFTGITRPKPTDRFFLVMGMTGSGKSTFVGRCTGKNVTVGHGLYSCTESIDVFDFKLGNHRVYLIDTPGFNDTNRSDIDTLSILATYLGASYANGVRIHGIIMLHPISDNRMSGSSMRNLQMLEAMCHFQSYHNLVIATTMWPEAPSYSEASLLNSRESELLSDERFFGAFIAQGATIFRHNKNGRRSSTEEKASARIIVAHLIRQSERRIPEILKLQEELVDQGKTLGETNAGIAVAGELFKLRQKHKRELGKLEVEMTRKNTEHAAELQELKVDMDMKLMKMEHDKQTLKDSIQDMHRKEEKALKRRIRDMEKRFSEELAEKEQELLDMEESLQEIRKDMKRRAAKSHRVQQRDAIELEKHVENVENVRQEVSEARDSYKKFTGQSGNLLSGAANGIASGVAAGMISSALAGGVLCAVM